LNFSPAKGGVKTGVQSVHNAPKTLDSGFRQNDVKKNQIDFLTPSLTKGEGFTMALRETNLFYDVH
jgi:hypothetical protein